MEKMIKIKLVKSPYGRKPNQCKTLKALGLTKINQIILNYQYKLLYL